MKIVLLGSKAKLDKYKEAAMFLYSLDSEDVKIYSSKSSSKTLKDAVWFKPSAYKSFEANLRSLVEEYGISPSDDKILQAVKKFS